MRSLLSSTATGRLFKSFLKLRDLSFYLPRPFEVFGPPEQAGDVE